MNIPTFFGPLYRDLFMTRAPGELEREAAVIARCLSLDGSEGLLDVGCGAGDLARVFIAMGHSVSGVDVSPDYIALARAVGGDGDFQLSGYNFHDFTCRVDAAYCWRTSFGFGGREDDLNLFQKLRRAIVPGGKLLLELPNAAHVLLNFDAERRYEVPYRGDIAVVSRISRIDALEMKLHQSWSFQLGNESHAYESTLNLYHAAHLKDLLAFAGFLSVVACNWDGRTLNSDDIRMVIVAQ